MKTPPAASPSSRRPPRPRITAARLTTLTACVLLLACDGDPEGLRGHSPDPPASLARAPAGAPRDACALIPVEHVAAIVGGPVVTTSDPGPRESSCHYTDESGRLPYIELTVYWTGGKEMLEIVQMGTALAARLLAEPGDEAVVDSIVRPGPVAGLGDVALFSDIMPSYVLTGDVLLELGMPLLPDARDHFRPLANTALGKL